MKLPYVRSKARWSAASMTFKTLLVSLTLAVASTASAQVLDKPTFKVGDRWKWSIFDSRTKQPEFEGTVDVVVAKIGDIVELSAPGSTDIVETWDLDGRMLTRGGILKRVYDSPIPWPLQVGKKYVTKLSWVNMQGDKGTAHSKTEVVGFEEVVVPAGKFMAAKLVIANSAESRSLTNAGGQPASWSERVVWWRAVGTGVTVRWTYNAGPYSVVMELVEHSSTR